MKVLIVNENYKKIVKKLQVPDEYIIINLTTKTFIFIQQNKEIEKVKFKNKPPGFSQTNKQFLDISQKFKTKLAALRSFILEEVQKETKISEALRSEFDLEDCIYLKEEGKDYFLFYEKKNKIYSFHKVKVNNANLTPADSGYKDFVYFIFSDGDPKAYKIGRTENPGKRFRQINGMNPSKIELLIVIPDGRLEKMYHYKYKRLQIPNKKEWFYYEKEIETFVKEYLKTYNEVIKEYERQTSME